jgi:maltooligosyltrehalose trehalohydrolase
MKRREAGLGAMYTGHATVFRVWAPDASIVAVVREKRSDVLMQKSANGFFSATIPTCGPGDLYLYRVDGKGPYPDPASRFQPHGVHGPSQVVDPSAFAWTDRRWKGVDPKDLILYELHIGTFTSEGTFLGAAEKLAELRDLGVTAVEVMPVSDFPGNRNWGSDGVALFAPARCYGKPDDLRWFVDIAHGLGLAVFLDVVYNHFGPDGAYHSLYSRYYFSQRHRSPWGAGINFDGPNSGPVREFFVENALRWIHEYHLDGLRLDATHAIVDDSPQHILASISAAVNASLSGTDRQVQLVAEDVRNLAHMVKQESRNDWGLDAVWVDDFHHQMRRGLAGDNDGYFMDFDGSTLSIAETVKRGWFYCGQYASYFERERGSDPSALEYSRFVYFIQNHDQVGNRAFGERLHQTIDAAVYRAASALLLILPEIPLIFMGQEWAADSPFLYFTDHNPELGRLVTEGRRREFERFAAFADPQIRQSIPDPQAESTYTSSRLIRQQREAEPHASVLRLYRALLALRRSEPALQTCGRSGELQIRAYDRDVLMIKREAPGGRAVLAVIRLRGKGVVNLKACTTSETAPGKEWRLLLHTEDPMFAPDGIAPVITSSKSTIDFARAGAVLLRATAHPVTHEKATIP